jgi:hypothetical protein
LLPMRVALVSMSTKGAGSRYLTLGSLGTGIVSELALSDLEALSLAHPAKNRAAKNINTTRFFIDAGFWGAKLHAKMI